MASKICLADEQGSQFDRIDATGQITPLPAVVTRTYTIQNLDDPPSRFNAENDLLIFVDCPPYDPDYPNLVRKTVVVEQVGSLQDQFSATVTWERWRPDTIGEEFLSGQISIQTEKVTRPINRIHEVPAPGTTPDNFGQAINVRAGDKPQTATVEGVDVPVPIVSFSLRIIYAPGTFNLTLLRTLMGYVGRWNSLTWRGFAAGEVQMIGVDGSDEDPEQDEIVYSFQARPNDTNIEIVTPFGTGGPIVVPDKRGWDLLWTYNRPINLPNRGVIVDGVLTAYVDQVLESADFNTILPP